MGEKTTKTNTTSVSHTHNPFTKLKDKTAASTDLSLGYSPLCFPSFSPHIVFSLSHMKRCEGGNWVGVRGGIRISPPHIPVHHLYLSEQTFLFSEGRHLYEGERSSFNLPHSCDHLQPEALLSSLYQTRQGGWGVRGEGGRENSPFLVVCSPPRYKSILFLSMHARNERGAKKKKKPPKKSGAAGLCVHLCPLIEPQLGPNTHSVPSETGEACREQGRGRAGAIETLLHDVLWLIEATFNLHWLPQALVWREKEGGGGRREGKRRDDGGGTDRRREVKESYDEQPASSNKRRGLKGTEREEKKKKIPGPHCLSLFCSPPNIIPSLWLTDRPTMSAHRLISNPL